MICQRRPRHDRTTPCSCHSDALPQRHASLGSFAACFYRRFRHALALAHQPRFAATTTEMPPFTTSSATHVANSFGDAISLVRPLRVSIASPSPPRLLVTGCSGSLGEILGGMAWPSGRLSGFGTSASGCLYVFVDIISFFHLFPSFFSCPLHSRARTMCQRRPRHDRAILYFVSQQRVLQQCVLLNLLAAALTCHPQGLVKSVHVVFSPPSRIVYLRYHSSLGVGRTCRPGSSSRVSCPCVALCGPK